MATTNPRFEIIYSLLNMPSSLLQFRNYVTNDRTMCLLPLDSHHFAVNSGVVILIKSGSGSNKMCWKLNRLSHTLCVRFDILLTWAIRVLLRSTGEGSANRRHNVE